MTLIALTIDTDCYDERFAFHLAGQLGIKLVDLTSFEREVATRCDSAIGIVHRLFKVDPYLNQLRAEILEAARIGNALIVGWSSVVILHAIAHVVRVRILSGLQLRERSVMKRHPFDDEHPARLEAECADALIARLIHRMAGADWRDPSLYHVSVNADGMSPEVCANIIRVVSTQFRETEKSREAVAANLKAIRAIMLGPNSIAAVNGHNVALTGIETHEDMVAVIERYWHGERNV